MTRRLPAVAASVSELRAITVEFARSRTGVDAGRLSDIALCVSEAASNAVAHAYPTSAGHITLTLNHTDQALIVDVCDDGVGTAPASQQPGLGLGVKIVEELSDATFQSVGGQGLRVTMRFPTNRAAGPADGRHDGGP